MPPDQRLRHLVRRRSGHSWNSLQTGRWRARSLLPSYSSKQYTASLFLIDLLTCKSDAFLFCFIDPSASTSGFKQVTGVVPEELSYSADIDTYSIKVAAKAAENFLAELIAIEELLLNENIIVRPNTALFTHLNFFHVRSNVREVSRLADIGLHTALKLGEK